MYIYILDARRQSTKEFLTEKVEGSAYVTANTPEIKVKVGEKGKYKTGQL